MRYGGTYQEAAAVHEGEPVKVGVLIHDCVHEGVEQLVQGELAFALGALKYQRSDERIGYRNGTRRRTLTAQRVHSRCECLAA